MCSRPTKHVSTVADLPQDQAPVDHYVASGTAAAVARQPDTRAGCCPRLQSRRDALPRLIGKPKPFLDRQADATNRPPDSTSRQIATSISVPNYVADFPVFTYLKGPPRLRGSVDLAAFDLGSCAFPRPSGIISYRKGAVVKTSGDALMATFIRPELACRGLFGGAPCMEALTPRAEPWSSWSNRHS